MKRLLNIGLFFLVLLLLLTRNNASYSSDESLQRQPYIFHPGAVIQAPEAMLPAFLLPENESNQIHSSKVPVTENRFLRPAFSCMSEIHGSLHSAFEYFTICNQILIRLTTSAIIFPFNYHW